ncbi:MAG: transposase [Puniceicoccaceae bacterium]
MIRRHRLRIKLGEGFRAYYHLMSRTVNAEKWFGLREKEYLRKLIRQMGEFSGVRVITYAVMDNHFHVLAEVPPERVVSDGEIVRRFAALYPEPTPWQPLTADALAELLAANDVRGQELREELLGRMHDMSWMMKTIKQRFAIWFNKRLGRFGPVWAERFRSVLVAGDVKALRTVAAYIDLNGVRAGLADDPKDYRFCGYAEAWAVRQEARAGLPVLACGVWRATGRACSALARLRRKERRPSIRRRPPG